jgi:hypothetical protein
MPTSERMSYPVRFVVLGALSCKQKLLCQQLRVYTLLAALPLRTFYCFISPVACIVLTTAAKNFKPWTKHIHIKWIK